MKKLNKENSKRKAVDRTKTELFAIVAGSAVISVFCLVAARSYLNQASFLNRVADAKEKTLTQLEKNREATEDLVTAYKTFSASDPNLIGGSKTGTEDRDGDNGKLILDALPSKYDFPALTASLEKLLKGYTINSITGTDASTTDTASQTASTTTTSTTTTAPETPVAIPFTLDATSDFKGMNNLVTSFERSIRPFNFVTFEMKSTTGNNVQATITANTFYLPEKSLNLGSKVIK